MGQNLVVWDPKGEFWEGAVVDDVRARALEARGVAVMPCIPDLFMRSGVGGFAKRAWGSGWPLDHTVPRMFAPLTVFVRAPDPGSSHQKQPRLHWRMRLAPLGDGAPGLGVIRVASDSSQHNPHKLTMSYGEQDHVDVSRLEAPDAAGGWTIGGSAMICVPGDAHYPIGFWGAASGCRCVWVAASIG
jgi:hypothetical protein